MYPSGFRDASFPSAPISQLSQLTIQIHTAAIDLNRYETYFGSESIGYAIQGAESMLHSLQGLMGSTDPETLLGSRDTRHDFRNKLAVVKGFGDLMKMDLPDGHPALYTLDRLTERCTQFSILLDRFRSGTGSGEACLLAG